MNLMEHVRGISSANARFREIVYLGTIGVGDMSDQVFNSLPEVERLRRGALLAEHWEAIAVQCEQSKATQMWFSQWTPEQMRAEAEIWRSGRDPRWEQS